MADAMRKHPEVDVLINFASLRSAYDSTVETMNYPQVSEGSGGRPGNKDPVSRAPALLKPRWH